MEKKLDPKSRRLLRILSDGFWYERDPRIALSKSTPQEVVDACVEQKLIETKRKVQKRGSVKVSREYQSAIRITALGKEALKAGKY